MLIHYISGSAFPSNHANAVHVMKMAAALSRCGNEVRLFARGSAIPDSLYESYDVPESFSITLAPGPASRLSRLASLPALRSRLLAHGRPDVYYGRQATWCLIAARVGIPLFLELHKLPVSRYEAFVTRRLTSHPAFHGLVVISDALRQDVLAWEPRLAGAALMVASDGADLPPVFPPAAGDGVRGDGETSRVGYVGSLYSGRGIELIAELAARFPDVRFDIVGGSADQIRSWKEAGVAPNLSFHGHVPHSEVAAMMREMDVLLAPYQRSVEVPDGADTARWMSPMKIFEYMAAARAIICSDMPVLREALTPGREALMVDPADAGAWASALRSLLDDQTAREALGTAARAKLEAEYTWDRRAERITDFIRSTLDGKRAAHG